MSARQNDFNKYAGKIINLKEFKKNQYSGFSGFSSHVKEIAAYPVTLLRSMMDLYKDGVTLCAANVYTTSSASASGVISPVPAAEAYFEAFSAMTMLTALGGQHALPDSFRKAIEKSHDYRQLLDSGQLVKAGGCSVSINLCSGPDIEILPASPGLKKPQQRNTVIKF